MWKDEEEKNISGLYSGLSAAGTTGSVTCQWVKDRLHETFDNDEGNKDYAAYQAMVYSGYGLIVNVRILRSIYLKN